MSEERLHSHSVIWRAVRLRIPINFRRLHNECGRHCTQVLGPQPQGLPGVGHREIARLPKRDWPPVASSLPRQGLPTIAHRFSGGTMSRSSSAAPTGATESRTVTSLHLPCDPVLLVSAVPHETCCGGRDRPPTVETVGYWRVSLAGQRREFPPKLHASTAWPRRSGRADRSRSFLRTMATTLVRRSGGRFHWPLALLSGSHPQRAAGKAHVCARTLHITSYASRA